MPKHFPGITHAIVKMIPSKEEMDFMNGMIAFVSLCFGPGDESSIQSIGIQKIAGPTSGVKAHIPMTPHVNKLKMKVYQPTIVGEAADEIKTLALVAFDRVKAAQGLKFGKSYRVIGKTVEELGEINAECSSELGKRATA